jgi:hypothetical protein
LDWPWRKQKVEGVTFQHLRGKAGVALDIQGQKVVAIRLPATIAREVAGQGAITPIGPAVGGRYESQTDQKWLIVTNIQNPLLQDYDNFVLLAARGLTSASGSRVGLDDLIVPGVTANCMHCGNPLPPNHIGSCPRCGKQGKKISAELKESIKLDAQVQAKT